MKCLLHCIFQDDARIAGEIGPAVSVVRAHGLAAAASHWLEEDRAPDVSRLLAYEKTIELLHASGTVIPLRYGCVLEQSQIGALLEDHCAEYAQLLHEIEGLEEIALRMWWQSPPNDPLPLTPGARHLAGARQRYGLTSHEEMWANRICGSMAGLYVQQRREARQVSEGRLVSMHFLLPKAASEDFRGRVRWISFPGEMKSLVSGPWPPYHFVDRVQP